MVPAVLQKVLVQPARKPTCLALLCRYLIAPLRHPVDAIYTFLALAVRGGLNRWAGPVPPPSPLPLFWERWEECVFI
jgi:hypothetical protein